MPGSRRRTWKTRRKPKVPGPYRDGLVHVQARMCDTCIFRPGNKMDLRDGRVEQMVRDAARNQSCIPCHQTLEFSDGAAGQSVCRGFFDRHPTAPLQIAERMGLIEFTDLPSHLAPRPVGRVSAGANGRARNRK